MQPIVSVIVPVRDNASGIRGALGVTRSEALRMHSGQPEPLRRIERVRRFGPLVRF